MCGAKRGQIKSLIVRQKPDYVRRWSVFLTAYGDPILEVEVQTTSDPRTDTYVLAEIYHVLFEELQEKIVRTYFQKQ